MTSSSPSARLRPFRPQPFGRYTLLSHLATGGMGEIYLARLEGVQGFEKLCVIKKILPQLAADKEFVDRFVGEARTLVKLSHGSIAQVLDMGLHEGDAYMALEYVDGKDLRKVAGRVRDRQMPLPLTFILFVMGRVLDALAYAHRKKDDDEKELQLVHRDISPQNILISYEGEVKVIDFGLAKSRLSAAKTNPSIILGKFLYMSPEQARHQPVDRRSDLYAVGLCLYELISGKNPFDSVPPGELMPTVANPRIPSLIEVEPFTPPAVAQLVMKALAVEPSQRFQTAEEFRGKLQSCLLEIDPSAGPESVTRFMRDLFSSEFQSERKLLAQLKDTARVSEAPASPAIPTETPAKPPTIRLPPKTIKLDGPMEPLSFQPTPRGRDGRPVNDGDTRPGIPMEESTRPGNTVESPEPISKSRLRPGSSASPDTAETVSIEVGTETFSRPPPVPMSAAAARSQATTVEVPIPLVPPAAIPPGVHPPAPLASAPARPAASPPRPLEPARPAASASAPRAPDPRQPPPPPAEARGQDMVRANAPTLQIPTPFHPPDNDETPGPTTPPPLPPFSELMPPPPPRETTDPNGQRPHGPEATLPLASPPVEAPPPPPVRSEPRGSGLRPALPEKGGAASRASEPPPMSLAAEMAAAAAADASRRGLDDTHPGYPVKPNGSLIHDTQPGVVLDEAALKELAAAEDGPVIVGSTLDDPTPSPQRAKSGRRPRVSAPGTPPGKGASTGRSGSVRALEAEPSEEEFEPETPQPAKASSPVEDEEPPQRDPRDETRRTPIPARPGEPPRRIHREEPRRAQEPAPAPKKRSWVGLVVTLLLLAVVGGAIAATYPTLKPMVDKLLATPEVKVPPAVPLTPPRPAEPAAPAPEAAPAPAGSVGATGAAVGSEKPSTAVEEEDPGMFVPLSTPPPAKKQPVRAPKKTSRKETDLQREWNQTSRLFIKLTTEITSCESPKIGILCNRFETLQEDVAKAGDVNDKEVLSRVKRLRRDIQTATNAAQ
jgi:serine/threonine protein kinase